MFASALWSTWRPTLSSSRRRRHDAPSAIVMHEHAAVVHHELDRRDEEASSSRPPRSPPGPRPGRRPRAPRGDGSGHGSGRSAPNQTCALRRGRCRPPPPAAGGAASARRGSAVTRRLMSSTASPGARKPYWLVVAPANRSQELGQARARRDRRPEAAPRARSSGRHSACRPNAATSGSSASTLSAQLARPLRLAARARRRPSASRSAPSERR